MELSIARIYENKTAGTDIRILVDRLWTLEDLQELDKRKTLLLLYGAKDKEQNHAVLLKEFLENI
ncbi:DUF488 family protein [Salegentibacter sp.]|uniref:DUF488 family protein n=1 Tax=Salegentibacter sp. TaxID=1903072 RepID=UPI003561D707